MHHTRTTSLRVLLASAIGVLALVLTSCGTRDDLAMMLITKDQINPYFVSMQEGADQIADTHGVSLMLRSGAEDGDEKGQITAIEEAIEAGVDGTLIAPNGPGVYDAIGQAREAGIHVIALDTPTEPTDIVDLNIATDNYRAGTLIGSWAAGQLGNQTATIALLDLFEGSEVSVDVLRNQGFLSGMGIDTVDDTVKGDEPSTGSYRGGAYEIACQEPTGGNIEGGRAAMETCLATNPEINAIYTINEPAALGALEALEATGRTGDDVIVVSVDGGCEGIRAISDGRIGATAQQYPIVMAREGILAIKEAVVGSTNGLEIPQRNPQPLRPVADDSDFAPADDLGFYDAGVQLVTNDPVDDIFSVNTDAASKICWGN